MYLWDTKKLDSVSLGGWEIADCSGGNISRLRKLRHVLEKPFLNIESLWHEQERYNERLSLTFFFLSILVSVYLCLVLGQLDFWRAGACQEVGQSLGRSGTPDLALLWQEHTDDHDQSTNGRERGGEGSRKFHLFPCSSKGLITAGVRSRYNTQGPRALVLEAVTK